ncbi:MAG: tRNA lysidine(34) synthetase TilS [Candidatus Puniceispirillaceae bacterium]
MQAVIKTALGSHTSALSNALIQRFSEKMHGFGLSAGQPVYVACSGGPDSLALALLAGHWASLEGHPVEILSVHHGLRPEAGDEIKTAQRQLQARNLRCQTLHINPNERLETHGQRPRPALQEWARAHRYRLLSAAVRQSGGVVLLGHHREDQAETIAMRLLKGSGVIGLAGMADERIHHQVRFLRPLLDESREQLAKFLAAEDMIPAEDPSNQDSRFERVRMRRMLGQAPQLSSQLLRLGSACSDLKLSVETPLKKWASQHITTLWPLYLAMPKSAYMALPTQARHLLLRDLLPPIGGRDYPPSRQAVERLDAAVFAGLNKTLSYVQIRTSSHQLILSAEPSRLSPEPVHLKAGESCVFDGRWLVSTQLGGVVNRLGSEGYRQLDQTGSFFKQLQHLPYQARLMIPVLHTLDDRLWTPHVNGCSACSVPDALNKAKNETSLDAAMATQQMLISPEPDFYLTPLQRRTMMLNFDGLDNQTKLG